MRRTTRRKAITGAVAVLALTLSACGGDEGDEPESDAGGEEPDEEDGGGEDPLADQSVGAMDEWGVGDTFVATEPVEFGLSGHWPTARPRTCSCRCTGRRRRSSSPR